MAVGDFNGDGRLDIAVANEGSNTVSIFLGNGLGGFATAVTYSTGGTNPNPWRSAISMATAISTSR